MRRECGERFPRHRLQRKPLVSDPGIHRGTCVTHVPWCMSRSVTRGGGENVPGIPGTCATRIFTYLARGSWDLISVTTFAMLSYLWAVVCCGHSCLAGSTCGCWRPWSISRSDLPAQPPSSTSHSLWGHRPPPLDCNGHSPGSARKLPSSY